MSSLSQDLHFAIRMATRRPGFTATVILTLALGIGANAAVFSLLNAAFWRPLSVSEPNSLVALYTTDERNPGFNGVSYPNFRDLRERSSAFSGLAAYGWNAMNLGSGGTPVQVFGQIVSGNYFSVLGVRPALGRDFLPEEDLTPGSHPVALLSDRLWRRRFGADPGIVGGTIELNGARFTVVGVAPPSFTGIEVGLRPELWVPAMMHERVYGSDDPYEERRAVAWSVVGRLRPGVSLGQAQSGVQAIASQLENEHPEENRGRGLRGLPLNEVALAPDLRPVATRAGAVLMTVVGLLLLVACANVASLLLARAAGRRREVALRQSLGASRGRLLRQMLTESLLLALVAGAVGVLIGFWTRDLLWSLRPSQALPFDLDVPVDARVLGFSLGVSLLTGVLFGLVPAWESARADLVAQLKERGAAAQGSRGVVRLRDMLVVGQVALSLVALVGAGLFLRSLGNARRIQTGFRTDALAVLSFNLAAQGYDPSQAEAFEQEVLDRVEALPGIRSATLTSHLPLVSDTYQRTVFLEGQDQPPGGNGQFVLTSVVSARFFETLGIPLIRGRAFEREDRAGTPRVVVVNEAMARRFWPGREAVGQRFRFFGEEPVEVVGVVANSTLVSLGEEPRACAYQPLAQNHAPYLSLIARTDGSPASVVNEIRDRAQGLDARMPLLNVGTMREVVEQSLAPAALGAVLLTAFAILALGLASLGLYGVMTHSVNQRTREIGIRIALGARPEDVLRSVVGRAGLLVGAGVVSGGLLAAGLARLTASLLYGVSPHDPASFVAMAGLLAAVALFASYPPARRAARIDAMAALRIE